MEIIKAIGIGLACIAIVWFAIIGTDIAVHWGNEEDEWFR